MRIKRVLALLLLTALLTVQSALAAGSEPTLSITSGTVGAGGEVTLTVSISDNPGMAACMIYIYYDTSVFSVDTRSDIRAAGAFLNGGVVSNDIAAAKENGRYYGDQSKDGVLALWYNGSGVDTTGDGAMMTITLQAKEGAPAGAYTVELGCSSTDTCNEAGDQLYVGTGSTTVTVTGQSAGGTTPETPKPDEGDTDEDTTDEGNTDDEPQAPATDPDETPTTPTKPDRPAGETTETTTPRFTDTADHWAERYINRAAAMGLIEGYAGLYRPNDTMTRAECVTILWRASGEPKASRPASFTDLTQDWYREAVAWAEENKVINGVGGGLFDPNGTVTREQLAAILHRQAGSPAGMELMLTGLYDLSYSDSAQISDWAKASLYWSIYNIIYCGENSVDVMGTLSPGAAATRAQIAVMIVRYLEQS